MSNGYFKGIILGKNSKEKNISCNLRSIASFIMQNEHENLKIIDNQNRNVLEKLGEEITLSFDYENSLEHLESLLIK